MRMKTSAEYARRHGAAMMKVSILSIPCTASLDVMLSFQVLEEEMLGDDSLLRAFTFSCHEIGIIDPKLTAVLPAIHQMLLVKMIHTHGNELIENRRMLGNLYSGVVLEVPLMLRDSLKVLAAKQKTD